MNRIRSCLFPEQTENFENYTCKINGIYVIQWLISRLYNTDTYFNDLPIFISRILILNHLHDYLERNLWSKLRLMSNLFFNKFVLNNKEKYNPCTDFRICFKRFEEKSFKKINPNSFFGVWRKYYENITCCKTYSVYVCMFNIHIYLYNKKL